MFAFGGNVVSKVLALDETSGHSRARKAGPVPARTGGGLRAVEESFPADRGMEPVTSCYVLIDRQRLRRAWLTASLESWALGGRVTALASAAELAIRVNDPSQRIELVILSVGSLTVADPAVAEDLRWLRSHLAEVPVVLLADLEDPASMAAALRAGVRGYLPTSIEPDVARQALALVLAGGSYAPPGLLLAGEGAPPAGTPAPVAAACVRLDKLTPRQREVLALLGQGRPNKVIAQRLAMCESTVKVHVRQIMRKLGASNRTEVALKLRELVGAPS